MENKNLIIKVIGFIQKNPKENLSLQSIAENAGFSLTYFDAIFRQHTGYTPVEYARVYKLTRCALALRRTEKSILDIALDFGYASPESFARAFKNFYGMPPSEYRQKYANTVVTWHDMSGKIANSHFCREYPELKPVDMETALDFCFTHNPLKYAEDIVGMTVAESQVLTLGDPENLEHFVYVSDYDSAEPFIDLVCEAETDAVEYLRLFENQTHLRFNIRKPVSVKWDAFDRRAEEMGLVCKRGYDMIYPGDSVAVPVVAGLSARVLTPEDMPAVKTFQQAGGCTDAHLRAIQFYFERKGNMDMKPVGVFSENGLICLAMPTLDAVRQLRKYDIGAIFALDQNDDAVDLLWKYVIDMCLREQAIIGNSNAKEDADTPASYRVCERIGLVKVAVNCCYSK
ncbi:MAG: helix-turn-helix transcriptional regulator [Oscillospiraceae bacterium]|nr:helix-turn-helix transcriptional regulator [Oscillospiraceae bacterium]